MIKYTIIKTKHPNGWVIKSSLLGILDHIRMGRFRTYIYKSLELIETIKYIDERKYL